ncbi:Periplasmic pH-dependent serine endoprotease DegQ [Tepidimonas thermarum]|uniref:Periplasmic pH-dependent serine endoprotease DegQ n=1 Tax=Tepidimonas thermarum TaxID=335431 RepID=A0A554X6Y9_9BURK|nr:trypsin-like peptidase domain-containing protein [Tepidimonas thermarum]TSE31598.1 Periplasmic pH-dependent serine endoprotease DegQ [Tepidimonas thermarum]
MKRLWLLFSQTVTVLLAVWFVIATLKPHWLAQRPWVSSVVPVFQVEPDTRSPAIVGASLSAAARAAAPAVVSISTSKAVRNPHAQEPWFRFFFGDRPEFQPQAGLGSGVIVSPAGYILTNNHVVEGADEILVQLSDGRQAPAQVIGTDPDTDLAVLRVALTDLPVIVLGRSESLEVGDRVLAIGNPFGVGQTVTAGIVSALGRNQLGINTFENFIQTDAAINPGNSGGALVDAEGHLVGINTAIYSRSGGSMGIGFAIPVATAREVMEAIVRDGAVTRGWIGVEPQELTPELAEHFDMPRAQGVVVTGVLQGGPAAQAGIRPGDIIVRVGDTPVQSVAGLLSAVAALTPGVAAEVTVLRREGTRTLTVVPARRPAAGS